MKVTTVTLLAFVAVVASKNVNFDNVRSLECNTAFGYHTRFGIPLANQIREAEAQGQASNIACGSPAALGEFPYQVGLIIDLPQGQSVCGGSILNNRRAFTAAHCWFDGQNQALRFTVVAGSVLLFSGGQRQQTSDVNMATGWNPNLLQNNIAMINLNSVLAFSNNVAAIALPSGSELFNNFAGWTGTTSGFVSTSDIPSTGQRTSLNYLNLPTISNAVCQSTLGSLIQATNICTSGANGSSTCPGYSGSPLVVTSNNRRILVGVVSHGYFSGCARGFPTVFTRVTSYIAWIQARL